MIFDVQELNLKKNIFILLMLFMVFSAFPKELKKDFRMIIELWGNPYVYETSYKAYGNSLYFSFMCGMRIEKFTIGPQVYENYFSFTGQDRNKLLVGAWNVLRGTVNGYFEPVSWFEMSWGVGGAWYRSAFEYNGTGKFAKSEGGVSAILNFNFRAGKYIEIILINNIDVFFSSNSATPFYYGGLRFNFKPGLDWLGIYLEAGGKPWYYRSDPVNVMTGIFLWAAGVSFDLSFPRTNEYMKDIQIKFAQKMEAEKNRKIEEKIKKEKEKEKIKEEKTAEEEKIVRAPKAIGSNIAYFFNIIFLPDSEEIVKGSLPTLEWIASVLKKEALLKKNFEIELKGYTNFTGDPGAEAELSRKRSSVVQNFLSQNGIEFQKIRISAYGGLYPIRDQIIDSNRRVEVKIFPTSK
jgi:outer membrane protein OmpA-like peptidoglycan-associated protein